ncbi:MAG TPA: alpha-galactosidase [Terriglobales bacterium]|nr:alpha-galactosidase [Terriglobales bacterium]
MPPRAVTAGRPTSGTRAAGALGPAPTKAPAAPPNAPAALQYDATSGAVRLVYNGAAIFSGQLSGRARATVEIGRGDRGALLEKIRFTAPAGASLRLLGTVAASPEAFAAETDGRAQRRFPLIRTSSGPDHNLRNHAVYDRRFDWLLAGPARTTVQPLANAAGGDTRFQLAARGNLLLFRFQPRFYQKFRGLAFYRPWTYAVWPKPVAGWSSWWAYQDKVTEADVRQVATLFARKLRDFGYQYIQLDDGYRPRDGYPSDWTATNAKFPSGLGGLAKFERGLGLKPAIWQNVGIDDSALAATHPAWFLPGPGGAPRRAPWVDFGLNGNNPAAVDALIRPAFRQLHRWGYDYVKVDTLRHLLYDASYPDRGFLEKQGSSPELAFRQVLRAVRQELGPSTYILACWGVLPEAIGLANADRLGTDGFGPATLQQYNSFNNVVWRNDPDHVDIGPPGADLIRPVEVSMAGAQLLLSDPAAVYANDAKLEGAKRSAPVLFTLPGQLYDYDPRASDNLRAGLRNSDGGANPGPIDAERLGALCPWWLMDLSRPFENWSVLARLGDHPLPAATVRFRDLGLAPQPTYLVYEFWTQRFLGAFRGSFVAPAQPANTARVYAIRQLLDHPQIVSTSRHITQGGVDLQRVAWSAASRQLTGASAVVAGDPYRLVLHLPAGYFLASARMDGRPAQVTTAPGVTVVGIVPARTGTITWLLRFR